jgi:hypothetical protein
VTSGLGGSKGAYFSYKQLRTLTFPILLAIAPAAAPAAPAVSPELEAIQAKLHALNLLNGLELKPEQMQLIHDAARQAEAIRAAARAEAGSQETELLAVGRALLRNAESGSVIVPQELKARWHAVNRDLERSRLRTSGRLSELTAKVRDGLEPHQLVALEKYVPCIIPPVETGHIGQADDASRLAKLLERARAIPQDRYESRIPQLIRRLSDRARSQTAPGFIMDRPSLERRLRRAADEARKLSDVDFALHREELAGKLKAELLPDRPPQNIGVKIERLLLQGEVVPILGSRLAVRTMKVR